MNIGTVFLKIVASDESLKRDLNMAHNRVKTSAGQMQSSISKINFKMLALGITAVATSIAYTLGRMIDNITEYGQQLEHMSERTGIAVETLSALDYASKIAGTSTEILEKGLKFLSNTMLDISRGKVNKTFEDLGISVKDASGHLRSTIDMLMDVADKMKYTTNETEKAGYAGDIFGSKMGTQLLPLLNLGSEGIIELTDKAQRMGYVFSTDAAEGSDKFRDSIKDINETMKMMQRTMVEQFVPSLTDAINTINELFLSSYKPMIDAIKKQQEEGKKLRETSKRGELIEKMREGYVPLPAEFKEVFGVEMVKPPPEMPVFNLKKPEFPGAFPLSAEEIEYLDFGRYKGNIEEDFEQWKLINKKFEEEVYETSDLIAMVEESNRAEYQKTAQLQQDLSYIFYNVMTDRITSMSDIWNRTWDLMRMKAFDTMIKMVTESAILNKIGLKLQEWGTGGTIEKIGGLIGGLFGGGGGVENLGGGEFAEFQEGGIVTRPTLAKIGEKGPEAVIPLKKGIGTTNNIYINAIDSKSFDDYLRRNPAPIINLVASETRKGMLRNIQ